MYQSESVTVIWTAQTPKSSVRKSQQELTSKVELGVEVLLGQLFSSFPIQKETFFSSDLLSGGSDFCSVSVLSDFSDRSQRS